MQACSSIKHVHVDTRGAKRTEYIQADASSRNASDCMLLATKVAPPAEVQAGAASTGVITAAKCTTTEG